MPLVLERARDRAPGFYRGPATAAARWRPLGGSGRRGEGRERQRAGQWVQGSRGVTRGAAAKLELACGRPREAAGGADCRRGVKQRSRLEVEERIILQFLKIPGTSL